MTTQNYFHPSLVVMKAIHCQTTARNLFKSKWQQKLPKWPWSKVYIPVLSIPGIAFYSINDGLESCGSCGWGFLFSLIVKLPIVLGKNPPVHVSSWAALHNLHVWDPQNFSKILRSGDRDGHSKTFRSTYPCALDCHDANFPPICSHNMLYSFGNQFWPGFQCLGSSHNPKTSVIHLCVSQ